MEGGSAVMRDQHALALIMEEEPETCIYLAIPSLRVIDAGLWGLQVTLDSHA